MQARNLILHDVQYSRLQRVLARTQEALRADLIVFIERSGQILAHAGPAADVDLTALGSLAAANLAATDGLAKVIGEPEFSVLYHQGKRRHIHISGVMGRYCMVVLFGAGVSLGMVRLRVRHATAYLEEAFRRLAAGAPPQEGERAGILEFTDEEIDRLFEN